MKINTQTVGSSVSFAQIVAGLSHHLNNPLAAILGYSELLLRRDLDSSARGMVELIHQQAERCKRTLQSLSEMTRRPTQGFKTVELRSLAQECMATKSDKFESHQVKVGLDFPAAGLESNADPIALQQVFFHLFDNAIQALENQNDERTISVSGRLSNGWIELQVRDNGNGIEPEVLPRIFEPFYSTKPKERSPGLGLTICLAILQEHDGRIEVESTPGGGTCVTLFLPDRAKPAALTFSNISNVLNGKRILLAEDEPALAQLLKNLLTPLNAQVVHVGNGLKALECAQQAQWDMIISDIQMPEMNGVELYHHLASSNANLANRMILITGSTRAQPELLLQGVKAQFLYKPFSRTELVDAIARVFAQASPEGPSNP